jgi:hypothetical protein
VFSSPQFNISDKNGFVAIGSNGSVSEYPLFIANNYESTLASAQQVSQSYFGAGSNLITQNSYAENISIYSGGSIFCFSGNIIGASDNRIKMNIKSLSKEESLEKIRKLNPSSYEYIDKINNTRQTKHGFIAQDVKNIIENAVHDFKVTIPNIFDLGKVKNVNIITLNNKTTDLFTENKSGNQIKISLNDKDNKRIETFLEKIIDEKTFQISDMLDVDEIFVNGQEVEDLLSLNKEVIFTHCTAALIELDTIVQKQQLIINNLESRLALLESKI